MTGCQGAAAFWVDREYDRDFASDDRSRYAAYVRQNREAFAEVAGCSDDAEVARVDLAGMAWRVATGPVMSPGYVRCHSRVGSCGMARSHWDGGLVAEVELVVGWPSDLARSGGWRSDRLWLGWPEEGGVYYEPSVNDPDLGRRSYLACTARAVFGLDSSQLPYPDLDDLECYAAQTVAVLVDELNPVVAPILAQLEGRS